MVIRIRKLKKVANICAGRLKKFVYASLKVCCHYAYLSFYEQIPTHLFEFTEFTKLVKF